ncbi:hypothetical protein RCJ22_02065, partial [Vibrio sp. FNV 38]|nr:hypothetical protein [Vibrio sp. FNV 38]
FLSWLNQTVEKQKSGCYLVGEAWTDQNTYASYYESGIDSLFDFAFAGQEGYIAALARGKRDASWYGEKLMEEEKLPLLSMESRHPLNEFDVIGFTLQYEMSYSNILAMMEMGGVPLEGTERGEKDPIVVAGGPCA